MKRNILLLIVFELFLAIGIVCSGQTNPIDPSPREVKRRVTAAAAIRAVIEAQRDAWNRGDIEGYMDGYERSPATVFISGDNLTRGWQTVLDRYKKGYDSREKMGTLTFSDLEITPLSKDAAVVLGRWHLQRAGDEPHGRFTLIFRRTKAAWRIVHDHTSSA
jgi:ketosteroid isomerase-like protein